MKKQSRLLQSIFWEVLQVKKRRPADVDLILLLKTKRKNRSNWSVDLVIAPDNKHGDFIMEDARKWMKQKYGAKNSTVIRLK